MPSKLNKSSNIYSKVKTISRISNTSTFVVIVWFLVAIGEGDAWADNLNEPFFALLVLLPLSILLILIRIIMHVKSKKNS